MVLLLPNHLDETARCCYILSWRSRAAHHLLAEVHAAIADQLIVSRISSSVSDCLVRGTRLSFRYIDRHRVQRLDTWSPRLDLPGTLLFSRTPLVSLGPKPTSLPPSTCTVT